MGAIAGICLWNGAPAPRTALDQLAAQNRPAGPDGDGLIEPKPGVALQAFALRFDKHSIAERQPHVTAAGAVVRSRM